MKKSKIQIEMSILFIIITTVILGGFAAFNYFDTKNRKTKELNFLSESAGVRLSKNLIAPIWDLNDKILEETIETEMMDRKVFAITVLEADEKTELISKKRDSNWKIIENKDKIVGNYIFQSKKIIKEEEVIGSVQIYLTPKFMHTELNRELGKISVAVLIINMALLLALFQSLKRIVIIPIKHVMNGLTDIAEGDGDLTKRIDIIRYNEIGELSTRFNTFLDNLQGMIKDIVGKSKILNDSAVILTDISDQMTSGSDEMKTVSNSVASATEGMSTNMATVATAMDESAQNIDMVAAAAEEMTATIQEIASNSEKSRTITNQAVDQAKNASSNVEELGRAANEIGKVTESITEISEQTKLLALNATIEAARAGEAGKGFAVVADEIKELARQTAGATLNIKQKISDIQDSSLNTVSVIKKVTEVINEIDTIVSTTASAVEEQAVTTKEIASNVSLASQGIQNANSNVSESYKTSQDIYQQITKFNDSAGEMADSSSNVNLNTKDLKNLAEQLNELVGRFIA